MLSIDICPHGSWRGSPTYVTRSRDLFTCVPRNVSENFVRYNVFLAIFSVVVGSFNFMFDHIVPMCHFLQTDTIHSYHYTSTLRVSAVQSYYLGKVHRCLRNKHPRDSNATTSELMFLDSEKTYTCTCTHYALEIFGLHYNMVLCLEHISYHL